MVCKMKKTTYFIAMLQFYPVSALFCIVLTPRLCGNFTPCAHYFSSSLANSSSPSYYFSLFLCTCIHGTLCNNLCSNLCLYRTCPCPCTLIHGILCNSHFPFLSSPCTSFSICPYPFRIHPILCPCTLPVRLCLSSPFRNPDWGRGLGEMAQEDER